MTRTEPEALLDAQALVKASEKHGINQPGMMMEVRDLLVDLHRIGSDSCLEAARVVSRAFAVVYGGRDGD